MIFMNPRRRRGPVRPIVLTERGQGLAVLLFAIAFLLWVCVEAKGL